MKIPLLLGCRDVLASSGGEQPPKKRGKQSAGAGAGAGASAAAPLLEHVQRLGKGEALHSEAWEHDLQASCAALVAASLQRGAAAGAKPSGKKRKAEADPAEGSAAALDSLCAALHALSSLELGCLDPLSGEALLVAGMAAALVALSAGALGAVAAALELAVAAAAGPGAGATTHSALLLECGLLPFAAAVLQAAGALRQSGAGAEHAAMDGIAGSCRRLALGAASAALCAAPSSSSASAALRAAVQQALARLSQDSSPTSWADAALIEAVLAACQMAVAPDAGEDRARALGAAAEIVCGGEATPHAPALADLQLFAALVGLAEAQLPSIAAAAAAGGGDWRGQRLTGSVAASRAHLLRVRCAAADAVDALPNPTPALAVMPADVQAAATALASGDAAGALPAASALQLVEYVVAACGVVRHMKPPASPSHYAGLLALVLHLLRAVPSTPEDLDPARHTLPFTALFPAAGAARGGGAARAALLRALGALLDGSSNQQLIHALRLAERALGAPGSAGAGAYGLPLAELALGALESAGGGGTARTLGQHADRLCTALTAFVVGQACPVVDAGSAAGPDSFDALLSAALAAAPSPADAGAGADAPAGGRPGWASAAAQAPAASEADAAVCTALRALESMVGRPRQFALSARHLCHVVHGVAALWAPRAAGGAARSPALFAGSCHLLAAALRHRPRETGRCLPLVAQAARGLLARLVSWDAAGAPPAAAPPLAARVLCAEALAKVHLELSGLKPAAKYCPHVLADYLVLAASPLTARARAVLTLPPPGAGAAARGEGEGEGEGQGEAEDARSGLLARETGEALRQGAYALYGACGPGEAQFLYAALGGTRGVGAWRTALAALKADHDKHFKYAGKV
jgi:hypothetical protein